MRVEQAVNERFEAVRELKLGQDELFGNKKRLLELQATIETQSKKIIKFKERAQRHHKVTKSNKVCNICHLDYNETENFNWSCVTHAGQFTEGAMWWCCGKTKKNAKGCKTQMHNDRDSDQESDDEIHH